MKNNAIAEKVKLQPRTMNSFLLNKARIYYVFVTCEIDVRPNAIPSKMRRQTRSSGIALTRQTSTLLCRR
jgi:hypothetical protein